ncbi:MAG TPA: T9SS type A sorting domain-containing protein [bacterium (Candidatus Stahlbacteria)]|nr:T9SS type A sorting domain-containing protein [Candidatus Stahlbacteria bacterium]
MSGSWYGEIGVSSGEAGWEAVGAKPSNNAGVCAYHMTAPGDIYRSWVAVDESQGGYTFTEHAVLPQETNEQIIWPSLAVDNQENFHVVNHSYYYETILYTRSTDGGVTWEDTTILYEESSGSGPGRNISGGVFADRWNTPGKIIRDWTEWTGEGTGGTAQHAQDVCYQISTDYGATWGPKINLTQYQPSDTMRAFCHIKGIFDGNGDPHIVFATNYFVGGTAYNRSWIIHWSPSTGFSNVAGPFSMNNNPGNWRLPCDYGNIALDRDNGWLYATYSLSRDTTPRNGDVMGKYSIDNGTTWISAAQGDTGVNLTKTPPGVFCNDDYPCLSPYTELIGGIKSLVLYYIEDNDTNSPNSVEPCTVRVYFCSADSLIKTDEPGPVTPAATHLLSVYPNPARSITTINYALSQESWVNVKVLDVTGRIMDEPVDQVLPAGYHTVHYKAELPPGVYFVVMEAENYLQTNRFVLIR